MAVSKDQVLAVLAGIPAPNGQALPQTGTLSDIVAKDGKVFFSITVDADAVRDWEPVRKGAEDAVRAIAGVQSVMVALTAERKPGTGGARPQSAAPARGQAVPGSGQGQGAAGIPGVRAIIAVASGKGGVGKSTTAVNLALGLRDLGLKVGILDADIYGPSLPKLLAISEQPQTVDGVRLKPIIRYGLTVMSIGFLIEEETPMIWRGPMVMSAINGDDARVVDMADHTPGIIQAWSLERPAAAWFDRPRDRLMLGDEEILQRPRLHLLGDHNVANALAAAIAVSTLIDRSAVTEGLASMRPLEHRLEPVGSRDGVQWINDSKSTNVASAVAAIRALTGPVTLILGGLDKGEDFTPLGAAIRARKLPVIAYGAAADRLAAAIGSDVERVATLAEAVRAASRRSAPGDAVLLSPACASFDQFENYIERGNTFRELVRQL